MSIPGLFAVFFVVLIQECISTECGLDFHESYGSIISPGSLPENDECEWRIEVAEGRKVTLVFNSIALGDDQDCKYGTLQVYNTDSPDFKPYCGAHSQDPFLSSGRELNLVFTSLPQTPPPDKGFDIKYFSTVTECGGKLTELEGSFTSPNYPNNNPDNEKCEWIISVPEGRTISLYFLKFDLNGGTRSCGKENVQLYDGIRDNEKPSEKYCNHNHPPQHDSTGSSMKIVFKSAAGGGKGFHVAYISSMIKCPDVPKLEHGFVKYHGENVHGRLVYSCEAGYALQGSNTRQCQSDGKWTPVTIDPTCQRCGRNLTSPTDVIMSPNYPNGYPTNTRCEWTINANESNRITLLFIKFDLEKTDNCAHDYVTVYDGPNNFSMPMGPFCGSTIPSTIESSSYSMKIVFQSGSHTQKTGFMAVYYMKMAEDNSITGAGALHSEGENKIPYFVIIFGILLGITVLLIIGLVAYITFVHRRKHEDPMEMYDNPVYDSTSDVTSLTPSGRTSGMDRNRSARSTETDTPEEMEIVDNLYYGSFEASGGDHGQGRANKSASKIGPITGDIYAEVQKDKPGQIYANQ